MKIGSLFDGSGGFPLAASMCGIEPVWASEVEPYAIAVTSRHFPGMKHLGDVSRVNGGMIDPVDVITFGSPCQDMSMAGKRKGIRHKEHGAEETTRSGFFYEAVRIIEEMREATNGEYPAFAVWENVFGAFSSNKGEDFRAVLQALIQIVEPGAVVPPVPKGGWAYADCWMGEGWSIGWRTFDAQYWGVPQRRRRVYLVLDLRGQRAGKILFERPGLRRDFKTGRAQGKGTSADAAAGAGVCDCEGCLTPWDYQSKRVYGVDGVFPTLNSRETSGQNQQAVFVPYTMGIRSGCEGGGKGPLTQKDKSATLSTRNNQCLFAPVYCIQGNTIDRNAQQNGSGICEDVAFALNAVDRHGVVSAGFKAGNGAQARSIGWDEEKAPTLAAEAGGNSVPSVCVAYDARGNGDDKTSTLTGDHENKVTDYTTVICKANENMNPSGVCIYYIVRRLTPTECARLQGFPDRWGDIDKLSPYSPEVVFWREVYRLDCEIKGKKIRASILNDPERLAKWHDTLFSDSGEYRMWGNGIALPCALYIMEGIVEHFAEALVREKMPEWCGEKITTMEELERKVEV